MVQITGCRKARVVNFVKNVLAPSIVRNFITKRVSWVVQKVVPNQLNRILRNQDGIEEFFKSLNIVAPDLNKFAVPLATSFVVSSNFLRNILPNYFDKIMA